TCTFEIASVTRFRSWCGSTSQIALTLPLNKSGIQCFWRSQPEPKNFALMITHNLPRQSTSFIGRDNEVAELVQLLADPACQLLTLVGPGGSGKTRLAIEIAGRKLEDFPNGVYLVPLAPLSSADNIVPSIAHSVTLDLGGGDDPRQGLLDYLRHKHLLLV